MKTFMYNAFTGSSHSQKYIDRITCQVEAFRLTITQKFLNKTEHPGCESLWAKHPIFSSSSQINVYKTNFIQRLSLQSSIK